jgi:predicted permease
MRGIPIQAGLVAFQIAVSFVLLSSAGLLLRTLQNAARVNLGFHTDHLLSAGLDLSRYGYDKAQGAAMLRPLRDGVSQVPGVEAAALKAGPGLSRGGTYHGDSTNSAAWDCSNLPIIAISPGYFQTLQIPLLRGRDFSPADGKDAPAVAIMSEAAAARCWPGKDPFLQRPSTKMPWKETFEVIGLASNVKYSADNEPPEPLLYISLPQLYEAYDLLIPVGFVVRTAVEPHSMVPAITSALRRLDANLVLENLETLDEALASEFGEERFLSILLLAFGGLALVLATAGLYGLLSYLTAQRTREFGIRLALGARRGDVMSLVLMQGGRLILGSVVFGIFAAAVSARRIHNLLFGVASTDPLTYAAIAAFVFFAGLIACALPAWRATRVDPMVALRYE